MSNTARIRNRDDEAAMPFASAAASKTEMSKLDLPQIADDASGWKSTHASRVGIPTETGSVRNG